MFDLGMQELIVIFIVALVVFGPKRLPELGRSLGKGINELKKAMAGIRDQMDEEVKQIKDPLLAKTDPPPDAAEKAQGDEVRKETQEEKQGETRVNG